MKWCLSKSCGFLGQYRGSWDPDCVMWSCRGVSNKGVLSLLQHLVPSYRHLLPYLTSQFYMKKFILEGVHFTLLICSCYWLCLSYIIFAIWLISFPLELNSVLGSTLVVAGMYILLWGKSNEAEDCVTKHLPITREDEDCSQLSHVKSVPSNLNST